MPRLFDPESGDGVNGRTARMGVPLLARFAAPAPRGSLRAVAPVQERRRRRPAGPPESGWTLGAGGLPKVFWAVLGALLLALAIYLLAVGYIGYGAVIGILAAAAAVNLL
jgi:hypothetical protein